MQAFGWPGHRQGEVTGAESKGYDFCKKPTVTGFSKQAEVLGRNGEWDTPLGSHGRFPHGRQRQQ